MLWRAGQLVNDTQWLSRMSWMIANHIVNRGNVSRHRHHQLVSLSVLRALAVTASLFGLYWKWRSSFTVCSGLWGRPLTLLRFYRWQNKLESHRRCLRLCLRCLTLNKLCARAWDVQLWVRPLCLIWSCCVIKLVCYSRTQACRHRSL